MNDDIGKLTNGDFFVMKSRADCHCSCHRHPGTKHVMACCVEEPVEPALVAPNVNIELIKDENLTKT